MDQATSPFAWRVYLRIWEFCFPFFAVYAKALEVDSSLQFLSHVCIVCSNCAGNHPTAMHAPHIYSWTIQTAKAVYVSNCLQIETRPLSWIKQRLKLEAKWSLPDFQGHLIQWLCAFMPTPVCEKCDPRPAFWTSPQKRATTTTTLAPRVLRILTSQDSRVGCCKTIFDMECLVWLQLRPNAHHHKRLFALGVILPCPREKATQTTVHNSFIGRKKENEYRLYLLFFSFLI